MLVSSLDSVVQLFTVLLIFIFVLALTYFITRFAAGLQKQNMISPNVDIVETYRIAQNKYVQIIRVGEKYFSIVVCKDTVTLLGEMTKDDITIPDTKIGTTMSFQEILDKAKKLTHKK